MRLSFATCLLLVIVTGCSPADVDCDAADLSCKPELLALRWLSRSACGLDRMEIIQPANWSKVQTELRKQAAMGTAGTPTVSTFGTVTGTEAWESGSLALNGKIYSAPYTATTFLKIDPAAAGSFCSALATSAYFNKF